MKSNYNDQIRLVRDSLRGLFFQDIGMRIEKKLAKEILLNNETTTDNGKVYWFVIKDLGLGVCEIRKAPESLKCTCVVKSFYDLK